MKHIILLHGLHMHAWSLFFLKKQLQKNSQFSVSTFGYHSTLFSNRTIDNLHHFIEKFPKDDEIYIIGHSMGGLIGRIFLETYMPHRNISLITLGTPHNGSLLGKKIQKSPLKILLGHSGKSGIVEQLAPWTKKYPLYCIAGISRFGVTSFLNQSKVEASDGTVFVFEAIESNCTRSFLVPNIAHTQLILSSKVAKIVNDIIMFKITH